jgi:voltage-gated potassium channel
LSTDREEVVLFGCGGLALAMAETLRERGERFLLASAEAVRVEAATSKGFDAVHLDYTDDEALKSIGVGGEVRMIFCLFEETASNLFLTLSARALAPDLTVVSICDSPASSSKLLAAGANKTIDPFLLTARWVHNLIRRPLIVETLYEVLFGVADLEVSEVTVAEGAYLAGKRLGDLEPRSHDILILGVIDRQRGAELLLRTNAPSYVLAAGDVLVVIGPRREIEGLRNESDLGSGTVGNSSHIW